MRFNIMMVICVKQATEAELKNRFAYKKKYFFYSFLLKQGASKNNYASQILVTVGNINHKYLRSHRSEKIGGFSDI